MSYKGYSPVQFARSASTTLADHVKDVLEEVFRNYQILAMVQAKGNVKYNCAGRGFDWPVQYKLHRIETNTGETARNFSPTNLWKTAALDYRGYQVTDAIYEREMLENRGEAGIVKVFDNLIERLKLSLKQGIAPEFYIDGNLAANAQAWHGIESFMGINGTVNISDGTQRSANAADLVGYPSDTYAGLSTQLGNYGGENESAQVWPNGAADPEFDFWSPLIVNFTSSALGGAADTWAAQGDEAMRFMIIHSQRNGGMDTQMTNIILARNLYFDFLNLIDSKERITITSENSLRALGFKNTVQFDGVEVSWETAVPASVGYGLNFDNIQLKSMYGELFVPEPVVYDEDTQAYKAVVKNLSNLCWKGPRRFGKLASLA